MKKSVVLMISLVVIVAMTFTGCAEPNYTESGVQGDMQTSSSSSVDNNESYDGSSSQTGGESSTTSNNSTSSALSTSGSSSNNTSSGTTAENSSSHSGSSSTTTSNSSTGNSSTTSSEDEEDLKEMVSSSVDIADTSDMDFTFEEEDTTEVLPEDGKNINISTVKLTQTGSGINTYTIDSAGDFTLTGSRDDMMIIVDVGSEKEVTLILNGVSINNSKGPAIYIRSAKKVYLSLAGGSENVLADGASYSLTENGSTLDATVFSKADLTVKGEGSLTVKGNYLNGIVSKDDLVISSGTITVTAKDRGICGKDCVKINNGNISIFAGTDGICSDNAEDTAKGYIYLYGGTIQINSGNDGIQAETVVNIEDVNLSITAGGGSGGSITSSTESYKGIKAVSDIYISGGKFTINSKDDCIHSNGTITISGGNYVIASGDDGVHADTDLAISGSSTSLTVTKSYEGIEATNIKIFGGTIDITASDDGINAAGGNNTTSGGGMRPGQGGFNSSKGSVVISGGDIHISQNGDGIDANGTLSITGGNVTVSGANSGDTAILDFDSTGTISGGTFIGTGASSMSQNFSSSSTQGVIMLKVSSQQTGTKITLKDSSGNEIVSYTAERAFSCIIISSSKITKGSTYTLTYGSTSASIKMSSLVYSGSGSSGGSGGNFRPW